MRKPFAVALVVFAALAAAVTASVRVSAGDNRESTTSAPRAHGPRNPTVTADTPEEHAPP
jgi:hypothetical protein